MSYKNSSVGVVFLVAATVTLIAVACGQERSKAETRDIQSMVTSIRTELESGVSQEREMPFKVRSFHPYIGDEWIGNAVAYGCYRLGQAPGQKGPTDAELLEDLGIIAKHWKMIRVYGADGDTRRIPRLIEAHNLPIKVIQGIWLEPEENNPEKRTANIRQVVSGIELAVRYPDIVIALSVGNETQVFWSAHKMNPENLIRYIRAVRNNVSIPVTTADDYLYWNESESRSLADEIDFVFTHLHPLWNGKTLDNAIAWMDETYRELQQMHPERQIVLGETGWATNYNRDKTGPGEQGTKVKGDVSVDAQAAFLRMVNGWIETNQICTFLFEAFDESWKGGGSDSPPNEIEKNWGVFNEDRTPKESFLKFLNHRPDIGE